jgi:hypothetical protein
MGAEKSYTDEQIAKAIKGSGGIMSSIAKRLKCNWNTARKYVNSKPEFEEMLQEEEEAVLDMGEAALYAQVKNQEAWAVKYLLATKGKKRGYVERQEVDHTTGGHPFNLADLLTFED